MKKNNFTCIYMLLFTTMCLNAQCCVEFFFYHIYPDHRAAIYIFFSHIIIIQFEHVEDMREHSINREGI